MKFFSVEVVTTQIVELAIPDELLTEGAVKEFSSHMFHVDSAEDLVAHAARYVVRSHGTFVEGVGQLSQADITDVDVTTEIAPF